MRERKKEYKPLLFTTTVRNPSRVKFLLNIFSKFNKNTLDNNLAIKVMKEVVRYGLYCPMKQSPSIKRKWEGKKRGEFSNVLLSEEEVDEIFDINPQNHKEAGFSTGWASRFATLFDFSKELGFVYFRQGEKVEFSYIGLKLAQSIEVKTKRDIILLKDSHPEFEQQAFLHSFAKYQRNNPFVKVLNDNVPLLLLLQVISKLNSDSETSDAGISKLELPFLIFWKDNNADSLYKLIKSVRNKYGFNPSSEVIVDICLNTIMGGDFKKFQPESIISGYPDEFIRKMRLTGLISLRGQGRFIDINKNEQGKVDYILKTYSTYKKYEKEKDYFDYMAKEDDKLLSFETKRLNVSENNKKLEKWIGLYSFSKIKEELLILSRKSMSRDSLFKYLSAPIRLEFLTALAIKSKFPSIKVIPNYPCDDEGVPTSTAGGQGNQGDIECFEDTGEDGEENGILVEVTMSEGTSQTKMEVWSITRHLEEFSKKKGIKSMCYFIAPTIFIDTERLIKYSNQEHNIFMLAKTIQDFISHLENKKKLYYS